MPHELELDDPIPFGKFKGIRVRYVLADDVGYLRWMAENTDLEFEDLILSALESEALRQELIDDSQFK